MWNTFVWLSIANNTHLYHTALKIWFGTRWQYTCMMMMMMMKDMLARVFSSCIHWAQCVHCFIVAHWKSICTLMEKAWVVTIQLVGVNYRIIYLWLSGFQWGDGFFPTWELPGPAGECVGKKYGTLLLYESVVIASFRYGTESMCFSFSGSAPWTVKRFTVRSSTTCLTCNCWPETLFRLGEPQFTTLHPHASDCVHQP